MGYRSEVGVLITVPAKTNSDILLKKLIHAWGDEEDFRSTFQVKKTKEFITLHCDWIKWYEDTYPEIIRFMKFITEWNYKTGGVHYVRIGESYEDVDELVIGEPAEYLGLERYIRW